MQRVYLDHTATTPVDPRVFEAMKPYFTENYGNASSVHAEGRLARAALDESRKAVADLFSANAGEVLFVSGGTEANNSALKGVARHMSGQASGRNHILTDAAEHHSVLDSCGSLREAGFDVSLLPVDGYGMVDPGDVRRAITPRTCLISVMHANNETGTINPVGEISRVAREAGVPFHTDAVQAFARMEMCDADLISASAHKIYGPKGVGALCIRKGVPVDRLLDGGGQERGRRAGTESVPLVVGFASAGSIMWEEREREWARLLDLKLYLRALLEERFPNLLFNGHPSESLPHVLSISFDSRKVDIDGEALLFGLDLAGIAVASGSACTSGSMEPSHVMRAMGRDEKTARSTLRFSMGRSSTRQQLDAAVAALESVVRRCATKPA
jgi:cysteine desulfurase